MDPYRPLDIEAKWQAAWKESGLYAARDFDPKPKFVMLTEFPYPSGDGLHLGHVREYTLGDVIARYKRMQGYNVLYPMGYDAFGLPTENYAIRNKVAPQKATERNIATFQRQFERLGYSFDWSRAVTTTDPSYYRWTQWLFLQFVKAGLAYQALVPINWCPSCRTGLSNEEVVNGRHERCDTAVEKKELTQWVLKITAYADALIDGLAGLDYPSRIADQQINWIGRSVGAEVIFPLDRTGEEIVVFTTRPDTLFGATFVVLAPEHPLVETCTTKERKGEVDAYVAAASAKSEIERQDTSREKSGVFTGSYAVNPVNGAKVPVWIADYVIGSYGTGAIMAVPAHDIRDWEFAAAFDIPVIRVIMNEEPDDACSASDGTMINSGAYDGMPNRKAGKEIVAALSKEGRGSEKVNYKIRDWIFSRQHYWGEPIPIIHCPKDGAVPVPDGDLPVTLPEVEHYEPTETGESPLAAISSWVETACPACGGAARRETDTMPNWAGSSWYYLRYFDPHNEKEFANFDILSYWGMVDLYLGGMEHTTLHLLYSRFWHEFFHDQGLVPTKEPYFSRRGQGIILGADGAKMSKSKGNVTNPDEIIESGQGADALRLWIAFLAPYDQTTNWNADGTAGTFRFLSRVWNLFGHRLSGVGSGKEDGDCVRAMNRAIIEVTDDLDRMSFNTAIASLMGYVNDLTRWMQAEEGTLSAAVWSDALSALLRLLSPFAPHVTEELWHEIGHDSSIHTEPWPKGDPATLVETTVSVVVQVNGKVRAHLECAATSTKDDVVEAAKSHERIVPYLENVTLANAIYIPGKLVNLVTAQSS